MDGNLSAPECEVDEDCDDSNICTDDICDVGVCEYSNNNDTCDDGNLCTVSDTCDAGTCVAIAKDCSSLDDQCNLGVCNPGTGDCIQDPTPYNGNPCDDGQVGTLNDTCSDGACTGSIGAASIPTTSEWGMIIFMTIIVGSGVVTLLRRRII